MDVFGAVYLIANAQQFWSELEDILHLRSDSNLTALDFSLRSFISLCASYHEQYLQNPLQLEHACNILLTSELFAFHSERMCNILLEDVQASTDPHHQLILYVVLLEHGKRNQQFLRSHKRWQPLLPLLMDHARVEIDNDLDDMYTGVSSSGSNPGYQRGVSIPIEAKLRSLSIRLLYDVCRVQKPSLDDLELFDDTFIEYLFDLVEHTRHQSDDTFNYSVIKLIVALNEQFMVASLHTAGGTPDGHTQRRPNDPGRPEGENRVLRILMSRLSSSMTFGENMIFMLNRAGRTSEDLVMQLLVLKILYLLFTTRGTSEFFYTNDLCVLVDVFLREIVNLDEDQENESLRHTYLRVLHPLLTKTQLRHMPYKRPQIVRVLESLIEHESIRDVNPTTRRLVQRCLTGEWCSQLHRAGTSDTGPQRQNSPGADNVTIASAPHATTNHNLIPPTFTPDKPSGSKGKSLKTSRSVDNLKPRPAGVSRHRTGGGVGETLGQGSNDSATSLPHVASAAVSPGQTTSQSKKKDKSEYGSHGGHGHGHTSSAPSSATPTRKPTGYDVAMTYAEDAPTYTYEPYDYASTKSSSPTVKVFPVNLLTNTTAIPSSASDTTSTSGSSVSGRTTKTRRAAPPPPTAGKRKPPAPPGPKNIFGATQGSLWKGGNGGRA